MPTKITMGKVVQIIISDIPHTVYITFTVFWTFSSCKRSVLRKVLFGQNRSFIILQTITDIV